MSPIQQRVSSDELAGELQQVLSRYFGAPRKILSLRRRRSNYSSSYTIENLEVELDRGKCLSLVFKDMGPASLLNAARDVRPAFLYNPQREIETYRKVLDPKAFGTAVCYGAVQRPEDKRHWLFLERVNGPLLWQVGRVQIWERAARWIARLHSHFRLENGRRNSAALPECLLRYDMDHCLCWASRAQDFVSRRRDLRSHELEEQFKILSRCYHKVAGVLHSMPQTFIHGEFYPSNIILRGSGPAKRVCPIDWEVAAVGPGLIDLAALTSGDWRPEQKKTLMKAYHEALEPDHGWPPSLEDMFELVEYCNLHLAVQWLGWARDWSPPKSHKRDWLREALGLARRLRLLT
jgi:thiamine kinase-like enzyme